MTTGPHIIGALLRSHDPLLALVPEENIKAGRLPEGAPLPALLVRRISKVSRQMLSRGAVTRKVDRVSVTVRAANYRDATAIIALVEACCADVTGDIAGAKRVAVLDGGGGPDLNGPGNSFEQSQDFMVSYEV